MDEVVANGDYDTVSEEIRKYVIAHLDEIYAEGLKTEHLYVGLLHTALKYDNERLDIVARVCSKMIPSGLLCHYLVMYEHISWKVAYTLSKIYDVDIEITILDDRYATENIHVKTGRGRLFYLKNNDV